MTEMGNAFLMVLTSALFCFFFFFGLFVLADIEKDVNGRVAARSRLGKPKYLAASLKTEVRLFVLVFLTEILQRRKTQKDLFMLWLTEVFCVFCILYFLPFFLLFFSE